MKKETFNIGPANLRVHTIWHRLAGAGGVQKKSFSPEPNSRSRYGPPKLVQLLAWSRKSRTQRVNRFCRGGQNSANSFHDGSYICDDGDPVIIRGPCPNRPGGTQGQTQI